MNLRMRRLLALLVCLCLAAGLGCGAFAVGYLPDVTAAMSKADYWTALEADPDAVLMTAEEIATQNAMNIAAEGTMMYDLKNQPEVIDGVAQAESLRRSAQADAESFLGWTYDAAGNPATQEFYDAMIQNGVDPNASANQPMRYGIAVNRTTMNVFASSEAILDDPDDPDFDYQYNTGVWVNEPLAILAVSADGAFYLARSVCCSGWVPAKDVALCKDKAEWLDAWDFAPEETLVVYGSKVVTATSNYAPEVSKRVLTQGTTLQLAQVDDPNALVNNRAVYNNHVVYLPVRAEDGSYIKKMALISENAPVSEGFLPLTQANIAMVALCALGDNYGWGGMLDADDCSGYVRNVYNCFGLKLARNTSWQEAMPVYKLDLSGMDSAEKAEVISQLPLGSVLFFNGHEMMLLGSENGKNYVISAVSSMMNPTVDGKRQRARNVVINTLEIKRANGDTWLEDLTTANVPYYSLADGKSYGRLIVSETENGTVSATPMLAPAGTTVTVTVQAARGYQTKGVAVTTDAGGTIRAEQTNANTFTFSMPSGVATVKAELAARTFEDVAADAYYYDAVQWAVTQGVTNGTSDTQFSPEKGCTRAEAITFLWRAAGEPEAKDKTMPFQDVTPGSYYEGAVLWAVEQGITTGTSATAFSPDKVCTRAEIVTFLHRYAGTPASTAQTAFRDVPGGAYYAPAVSWAVEKDITKGTSSTTFSPDDVCTRAQIVTFLYRYAN